MFAYLLPLLRRLRTDRRAVTALEYGVIAAGTVVAIYVSMGTIKTSLAAIFASINTAV